MAATKQKSMSKKRLDSNAGLMVSTRVQLTDVRLTGCECEQKPPAGKGKRFYNISTSAKASPDAEGSRLVVTTDFRLEAFLDENDPKPVLAIRASFLLIYEVRDFEGLTEEGFQQFADLNGVFNAWPYWREFVQNTVGRMGLPPLIIPVFRVISPSKEHRSKKKARGSKKPESEAERM